jgi:hypothetical protein
MKVAFNWWRKSFASYNPYNRYCHDGLVCSISKARVQLQPAKQKNVPSKAEMLNEETT